MRFSAFPSSNPPQREEFPPMSCRGLSVSSNYAKAFWSPAFVGMWLCLMAAASANAANVMPEEKAAARQWYDAQAF